jgi:hypothetical protein
MMSEKAAIAPTARSAPFSSENVLTTSFRLALNQEHCGTGRTEADLYIRVSEQSNRPDARHRVVANPILHIFVDTKFDEDGRIGTDRLETNPIDATNLLSP